MKRERGKDICFILYMLVAVILAVVYFTVPERSEIIDFNVKWWKEMLEVVRDLISME